MKLLMLLFAVIGIVSLIYYGIIVLYAGFLSEFAWFWPMFGIGNFIMLVYLWCEKNQKIELPWVVKGCICTAIIIGISVFIITEVCIIGYANKSPKNNADYMIVLGAKVRKTTVTNSLKMRLNKAVEYKNKNPKTKIIVSGGQGVGEDITEAEAMKQYLIAKGIDAEDIIKEDKSTNTNENIIFSKKIIEQLCSDNGSKKEEMNILVVTNGFHIYRAIQISKKQGMEKLEGLAAKSDVILCVNYYVREVFAVLKDKVVGNIL